jgi:hypothetical protein
MGLYEIRKIFGKKEMKQYIFHYIRNKEKAPYMGSRFGQDIEPKGKYIGIMSRKDIESFINYLPEKLRKNYETGIVEFKNPLFIEHENWKLVLSKMYGNKKKRKLSIAIINDGYDGIITLDKHGIVETVDLASFK